MSTKSLYVLICYMICCTSNTVIAQHWEQIGAGTDNSVRTLFVDTIDNTLYLGGNFKYIGNPYTSPEDTFAVNGIAEWNGSSYSGLGMGQDLCFNFCNPIRHITRFREKIYSSVGHPQVSSA